MRIEVINGQRVEFADEGNWLYNDTEDGDRYFTNMVYLGKDANPWDECTDAQMREWKEQHPKPEPEEELNNE